LRSREAGNISAPRKASPSSNTQRKKRTSDYRDVIREPQVAADSIAKFLETPLNIQAMVQQVDGKLYRNRAS
jgi:hypothetical protein